MYMSRWGEMLEWCDKALLHYPDNKTVRERRAKAVQQQKAQVRKERQELKAEALEKQELCRLKSAFDARGVTVENMESLDLCKLEPSHPAAVQCRVHIDEAGCLVWPVMFIYPEYHQTDFIQQFNETSLFSEHVESMFSVDSEPLHWDREHKYRADTVELFYEVKETETLIPVPLSSTLQHILAHKQLIVRGGTPAFIVVVKESTFMKEFLKKYNY